MKPKTNIVWTVLILLALAICCSFFLVDKFKIANGQFYRDSTHTYSDKICTGSNENGSKVCTNYYFTEKQHSLNSKLDQIYKVLIVLALIALSVEEIYNSTPRDKKQKDPISQIQTNWAELVKENEKERNDPNHGWTKSGIRTFLLLSLLVICLAIIQAYLDKSDLLKNLLKIN